MFGGGGEPYESRSRKFTASDVNFEKGWLEFGQQQFGDINPTKEGFAIKLPLPQELEPILRTCIGGRVEGPLLRGRKVFEQGRAGAASSNELRRLYDEAMGKQPCGSIQAAHDKKLLFRRLLRELGGVAEDDLAKEFKKLLTQAGITNGSTLYTLRSSVTTALKDAGVPHLELRPSPVTRRTTSSTSTPRSTPSPPSSRTSKPSARS